MSRSAATATKYGYTKDKSALLARLKRMEGQARGIQQMIEDDRYCIDIIQQLTALSAAADEASLIILESHIEGCVSQAIREEHGQEHIKELMATLRRAIRR
ncbi:MAG: metal-sensitive transcriptional regulator [Dehalococcoidales bacterium]|jgi:DNA-binding FrmR family transcriptional regulator